jgi:lysozyme family protein
MKFKDAVEIILKHEGGYVNHAKDPGGETNFGISKKAFPDLNIKALTKEAAEEIYRKFYWDACRCNELPPKLRLIVFDGAVNQGRAATVGLLQVAVGVKVDGVMGEETIKGIWGYPPELAVEKLAALRCARYFENPKFKFFGAGWLSRLVKISVQTMREE